ncbi:MAG: hemerythrin domain-containing protein, partial [Sphingomonas sp.]
MASKATERKPNETDHGAEEANKSSGAAAQSGSGKSSSDESHGQSTQAQNKDGQQGKAAKSGGEGKDAVELIKEDHRRVEKLFDQFQQSRNFNQKKRLVEQICIELNTHTLVEEQIFYPACRGKVEDDLLDEAQVEHDGCKQLIMELQNSSPVDQYYEAKVKVLSEYVRHHVAEEEKTGDGILDAARKAGVDMMALGQEIEQRRPDLQQQAIDDPEPDMPSMDEGRSSQAGRSQQQRGGYASSQGGQGRASQGGGGSRQGSGWYGDAEGHAQAARRGHQQEDGRRYASQSRGGASRYDEDERGGGR